MFQHVPTPICWTWSLSNQLHCCSAHQPKTIENHCHPSDPALHKTWLSVLGGHGARVPWRRCGEHRSPQSRTRNTDISHLRDAQYSMDTYPQKDGTKTNLLGPSPLVPNVSQSSWVPGAREDSSLDSRANWNLLGRKEGRWFATLIRGMTGLKHVQTVASCLAVSNAVDLNEKNTDDLEILYTAYIYYI